jgi:hypothetical protein
MLVGLLSSSMGGDEARGPAFLSLLWPVLGQTITPPWPPGLHKAPTSLLEIARRLNSIDRPDAVRIEHIPGDTRSLIAYSPWES